MLELLAAEMRIAELEKALEKAREDAYLDPLTGALNRRGFDKACQRELSRIQRKAAHYAIAYIDLDDFKKLNGKRRRKQPDRHRNAGAQRQHRGKAVCAFLCASSEPLCLAG